MTLPNPSAGRATPTDIELMRLHVAALFQHDARGRIVCTNEPDGDRAPRLCLGRTNQGNIWRFRDDLADDLVAALDRRLAREPAADDLSQPPAAVDDLRDLLQAHAPIPAVWAGPAWRFPDDIAKPTGVLSITIANSDLLRDHFPWTAREIGAYQPCYAVVRDGTAVSICRGVRLTASAAEAGVDTVEAHRGRGHATSAAAAWAIAVRASGRIPLYSTSWDNVASRRVAQHLGLVLYGADFKIL